MKLNLFRFIPAFIPLYSAAFLFCLGISILLWLFVVLSKPYESHVEIPLKFSHEENYRLANTTVPRGLRVYFRASGITSLVQKKNWTKDTLELVVRGKKTRYRYERENILTELRKIIPQSLSITRITPDRISLQFVTIHQKKVPVIFQGEFDMAPNFVRTGNIKIEPDSVKLKGTSDELRGIGSLKTDIIRFRQLQLPVDTFVRIESIPSGMSVTPGFVSVSFPVERFTEGTVSKKISAINLPAGTMLIAVPSNVKIFFTVPFSKYEEVDENDFEVVIDYLDLDKKDLYAIVRISKRSRHALSVRIEPSSVRYSLRNKAS